MDGEVQGEGSNDVLNTDVQKISYKDSLGVI